MRPASPAARTCLRITSLIESLQKWQKQRVHGRAVPKHIPPFPAIIDGSPTSFRVDRRTMISVHGVSMRYGSKVLFEDLSVTFSQSRRYGLTGPNGAGKSTFMKLLTGELPPQRGTVVRPQKLGVLRQDQFAFDRFRVVDTVIMGNARLWSALEEREVLYAQTDMSDDEGMRLAELEGVVGEEDGYTAESDAAILLEGLDIPQE